MRAEAIYYRLKHNAMRRIKNWINMENKVLQAGIRNYAANNCWKIALKNPNYIIKCIESITNNTQG